MTEKVRDVMRSNPICLSAMTPATAAAMAMRDAGIGDVIVQDDDGQVCGIVTDRDIAVRVVADELPPETTLLAEIYSRDLVAVAPDDTVEVAVGLMSARALRRLPVLEGGRPVGIVSLGDLAVDRDPNSALAAISAAPPNV